MKIEKIKVNELISPDWNPRQITEEELEKLETSLREFGYVEPIIVNSVNNHVVGGNQRLKALKQLGYTEVDCVYVPIKDINKEKALNVALNKISGDWDNEKLGALFKEIKLEGFNLELTGFDEIELDFYLDEDIDMNNPFDFDMEEDEEDYSPEDIAEDIEGERINEQFVVSISFRTREGANDFLNYLKAPYELTQRSVGIHEDEITWGDNEIIDEF